MQCSSMGIECETQASKSGQGWYYPDFAFMLSFDLTCMFTFNLLTCIAGAWTWRWRCSSNYQKGLSEES